MRRSRCTRPYESTSGAMGSGYRDTDRRRPGNRVGQQEDGDVLPCVDPVAVTVLEDRQRIRAGRGAQLVGALGAGRPHVEPAVGTMGRLDPGEVDLAVGSAPESLVHDGPVARAL